MTSALNSKRAPLAAGAAPADPPPASPSAPRPARPKRRPRRDSFWGSVVPPVVIVVLLLVGWELAVTLTGMRPQVLPAPSRVVVEGFERADIIWGHTLSTLQVTVIGFAFSLIVAWIIAVAIDFSGVLRRGLMPLLVASQTIPIIAIAPLMIIWFGFGLLPKILVVALVTFFPIVVGLIEGFNKADRETSNLLRSMGAGRWKEFTFVRLPSALPSFFTALRISITYAVVGAIFAEYVGAQSGLGIFMSTQKNAFRTDLVLAAVAVTAVLSISLYLLTFVIERLVIPWSFKERKARGDR
ncbi:ABC transporter permease [Herbiconiux sp. CPCC 203407]|uniref:ABC transporter permease n=1 Tax=Herbiconiux oxytropis TaxID=2970915 RepID=A0AA41XIU8_9MICO|nr:ABC transporter permease [Herbiconiux oxytropis]MCS5722358.1 ABC transporter permease [Herbiconiux oxytropis]MCS5727245.1 ABC transporter permease [Herbiconiux oxytropis]